MADKNKNINTPAEKPDVKSTKSEEKKPNFFATFGKKLVKFLKDTKGELKKVVWTSKSEVWKSFQLVIATVVGVSVAIAVIDYVSSLVINTIAGLIG
ncbi:MAG: preprotein translocase subunit SecE [Clostridia bacterium]|nr:preprotein translocase subunit SecE [Clostridia bacterium]